MKITTRAVYDIETGKLLHEESYEYSGPMELAIRAATTAAKSAAAQAKESSAQYGSQGTDIGSMLVPELSKEALHPAGFDPSDLNSMLVAGEGGAGGANASIAGEAGLQAARSRNNGNLSGVLDEAAREKGRTVSQNALDVQGKNAMLKESQRQSGLAGLSKERGTDVHADLQAQGLVPEDIKAWADANSTGWLQNTTGMINAISGAASAAPGVGKMIRH